MQARAMASWWYGNDAIRPVRCSTARLSISVSITAKFVALVVRTHKLSLYPWKSVPCRNRVVKLVLDMRDMFPELEQLRWRKRLWTNDCDP